MKYAKKAILGIAITLGVVALAVDYGNFYCNSCEMPMNHIDLNNFKGVFVNNLVNKWENGDTFSICNGRECQQYRLLNVNSATSWTPVKRIPMIKNIGPTERGWGAEEVRYLLTTMYMKVLSTWGTR